MEKGNLEESFLVNLRCVTQSCKGGVPISRLQDDFRSLIGTTIDFRSMGFTSLDALLQTIPQVVKLRRNPDGQTIAEAVPDDSTAHLASLISNQKSTASKKTRRSSHFSQKYGFHRAKNIKSSTPAVNGYNTSEVASQKDKEIEDLKSRLEKEKKINQDLSFKMIHLNSLIKLGQDSLTAEQELVITLKREIDVLKLSSVQNKNSLKDLTSYIEEIEELKSKLESEEKINETLRTQITHLSSFYRSEKENLMVEQKRLQTEIQVLQQIQLNKKGSSCNLVNLPKHKTTEASKDSCENNQASQFDNISLYQEGVKQMIELKTDMQQQKLLTKTLEEKVHQQNQLYNKLASRVTKLSKGSNSPIPESIIQSVMENLLCHCPSGQLQSSIKSETSNPQGNSVKSDSLQSINLPTVPKKSRKKKKKT